MVKSSRYIKIIAEELYARGFFPNMPATNSNHPILEMRIPLTTSEYNRLTNFYCDGLGIQPVAKWNNGQGQALVPGTFNREG